ncbi:MAG TPA: hypothetical protein VKE22_09980 [Haliangiales bacterium]|nr:hypothetical protein [Haliangiales bacterium]
MTRPRTKTEAQLDEAILRHAGDAERVMALEQARRFKRSWIDLAESLTRVRDADSFRRWGFASFEEYCAKELHLRAGTVDKLCASFRFLRTNAPRLIREEPDDVVHPVPSWQAVDFVARAEERGAADEDTLDQMKRAVFEEGVPAPALARRFREVAFPLGEDERRGRSRSQIAHTARRLADLVAEADSGVPRGLAEKVEGVLGELVAWSVD